MNTKLTIAKKSPDFRFKTPWDKEAGFHNTVGNNPAVIFFLRYIGCPVCQMEMARIKSEVAQAKVKGLRVFVVLQSAPETVASLINKDDFPFTIICDPEGRIFQLYGVEAGGFFKYLHPEGAIAAIRAIGRGFKHGKFEGKETQVPAAFAMSSDKLLKYAYYGAHIGDVPALEQMLVSFRE